MTKMELFQGLHKTLPCILSPAALTPEAIEDQIEALVETPTLEATKLGEDAVKNITLPKDFNPVSVLQDVESLFHFSSEVLHTKPKEREKQQTCSSPFKNAMAQSRVREMQTLGCLLVELYLANKLKASNSSQCSFEDRLQMCLKVVEDHWKDVPFAVRKVTSVLLEVDDNGRKRCSGASTEWYKSISHNGLPPPSAHQLLQPLLSGIVPFPQYFEQLYVLLAEINKLESMDEDTSELEINIFHKEFPSLLPVMDADGLNLLMPHVVRLLKSESATNAAWRLFDPLAKALGPEDAAKDLLEPISELMDSGGANRAKLYHRSFLLKLMVRFGMKAFISNFIKSLVEAVGGYKDQLCKSPTLESERRKSEALTAVENFTMCDGDAGILSPLDEDSSVDSDKQQTLQEVEPDNKGDETDTENEPGNHEFYYKN
jgi:WD repeat-containing protein 81